MDLVWIAAVAALWVVIIGMVAGLDKLAPAPRQERQERAQ